MIGKGFAYSSVLVKSGFSKNGIRMYAMIRILNKIARCKLKKGGGGKCPLAPFLQTNVCLSRYVRITPNHIESLPP